MEDIVAQVAKVSRCTQPRFTLLLVIVLFVVVRVGPLMNSLDCGWRIGVSGRAMLLSEDFGRVANGVNCVACPFDDEACWGGFECASPEMQKGGRAVFEHAHEEAVEELQLPASSPERFQKPGCLQKEQHFVTRSLQTAETPNAQTELTPCSRSMPEIDAL
eukprot:5972531-Amphidinium_carterae.3